MTTSKNNFKNFWHYNKFKIFAGILALVFIVFAITQCNINPDDSFGILCISETKNGDGNPLLDSLKENVDFGNDLKLSYEHIYVPKSQEDQMEMQIPELIQVRMVSGDNELFLIDSETIYYYEADGAFQDLTAIADKYGISEQDRYYASDNSVCAISVASNAFLESCSINTENMFVAIRVHGNSMSESYKNAYAALEYIISNR